MGGRKESKPWQNELSPMQADNNTLNTTKFPLQDLSNYIVSLNAQNKFNRVYISIKETLTYSEKPV